MRTNTDHVAEASPTPSFAGFYRQEFPAMVALGGVFHVFSVAG